MQWYTIQYTTKTGRVAILVYHTETKQNKPINKAKTKKISEQKNKKKQSKVNIIQEASWIVGY